MGILEGVGFRDRSKNWENALGFYFILSLVMPFLSLVMTVGWGEVMMSFCKNISMHIKSIPAGKYKHNPRL